MSEKNERRQGAGSAGAELAAAREELNLSIAEVARHLKLSPAQVEALEAGAYERLPGRVFVRGFLRNYAKLLGLEPEPLIGRLESEMPEPRVVEERPVTAPAVMPTGERSRLPLFAGIAGTIIAALAAYEFGFNSPPSSTESEAGPASAAPPTSAASESAPAVDLSSSPAVAAGSEPASPSASEGAAAAGAGAAAESAAAQPDARAGAEPGARSLHFRFDAESWVEVRDANDKVIFTKLNKAGSEERITGAPPLRLVVGNARAVRLEVDSRPLDLAPYTGTNVARLTLK